MLKQPRINLEVVRKSVERTSINSLKPLATNNATRRFEAIKNRAFDVFDEHPVTQELEAGPEATSTLLPVGNLFSFIGFNAGDNPVQTLRAYLYQSILLNRVPSVSKPGRNRIVFSYRINIPTQKSIEAETPMPEWSSGSWVSKIEKGISGLERYIFGSFFSGSRSTTGLQVPKKIRGGSFKGVKYVSEILNKIRNDASV